MTLPSPSLPGPPRAACRRDFSSRVRRTSLGTALVAAGFLVGAMAGGLRADEPGTPRPIRVVCLDVFGTGAEGIGPKNLRRCLGTGTGFTFRTASPAEIRAAALATCDVLVCPGGSGSGQSKQLEAAGRGAIQEFVRAGGGYVGICAGAYLATSHYPWSLGILDAEVRDTRHWARGTGTVVLELSPLGRRLLGVEEDAIECYYGQGPLLAPGNRDDLPDYEGLATYGTEIAEKGAPSGVMIGTTAIAAGSFGRGRVLCFSPHPEKTQGLDPFIRRGTRWAAGRDDVADETSADGTADRVPGPTPETVR
jgi:hypothetical protein